MNILIPMAGAGKRFAEAGYDKPKPLIDVYGKPMIQRVIENLGLENDFIFIIQKDHWDKYSSDFLRIFLKANSYKILLTDGLTEGALCTCMIAQYELEKLYNEPLMIANSDQIMEWDRTDFYEYFYNSTADGTILTFNSDADKHSYVKIDENGFVTEVAEKKVISNIATVGVYVWRHTSDFLAAANQMLKKQIKTNGEYYLAPTFNENIAIGRKIETYNIQNHHPIGTPEDLKKYEDIPHGA